MIVPLILAAALEAPDPAPLRSALNTCDRGAIAALTTAEPRRRATFSGLAYDEQRAIANERARLDLNLLPAQPTLANPLDPAVADRDRRALDARQRRLDDARTVERAWRESLEEARTAFLAQCTGKRDNERQP